MDSKPYPILEFDPSRQSVLEPTHLKKPLEGMPEAVVMCFFQDAIASAIAKCEDCLLAHVASEIGENPIYVLEYQQQQVALVHAGVGAPLSGSFLEELIAYGGRKFIACGGAGVLVPDLVLGHLVIPNVAVRDEGTSYHYLPPSREVEAHPEAVAAIATTLEAHQIPYLIGKTWTNDAIYRETPTKVAKRRDEGCVTVEMEAAAFFAIAQFRDVVFGQILYSGDDVSGSEWDQRGWDQQTSIREQLLWLAVEAVLRL